MSSSSESEVAPQRASKRPMKTVASKRPLAMSGRKSVPAKRPRVPESDGSESDASESEERVPKKAFDARRFIDMDADEADDDEEVYGDGEINEEEQKKIFEQYDRKRAPLADTGVQKTAEEEDEMLRTMAEKYEQKYAASGISYDKHTTPAADIEEEDESEQSYFPSISDSKLWLVRCKPGKERHVVLNLISNFYKRIGTPKELFIKSAFTTDSSPGYFYVEADKEAHVKKALDNVRFALAYKVSLVPLKEMLQAIEVKRATQQLEPGQWVQIKRGMYKDDVAQVYAVESSQTHAIVRIIPRIDTEKLRSGNKSNHRPTQRLFNPKEMMEVLGIGGFERRYFPHTSMRCYVYNGQFYKKGFLFKSIAIDSLGTSSAAPSVVELELFNSRLADADSDDDEDDFQPDFARAAPVAQSKGYFSVGNTIRVIKGDLKNLTGSITSVYGDMVRVKPSHAELKNDIEFPISDIEKYFKLGDHVKITQGEFLSETGLIVNVDEREGTVIVFSDVSSREMKVSIRDIVESTEVTTGRDALGNYELHDLVTLGRDNVGIIAQIDQGFFKILDTKGVVHRVRLQDIGRRKNSRFAIALDSSDNQVTKGDMVKVINGTHRNQMGTIMQIFRSFAFILSREVIENSGIFVVRSRDCAAVGQNATQGQKMPTQRFGMMGGKRTLHDPLMRETVVITSGPYKSLLGIVKDCTDTNIRVELHSKPKTVSVRRDQVKIQGSRGGFGSADGAPYMGSQTPLIGSQTPYGMDAARTPNLASMTPMGAVNTSNAWAARTPMTHGGDEFTARTPKYNPNSGYGPNTPFDPATPAMPETPVPNTPYTAAAYDQTPGPNTPGPDTPAAPTPYTYGLAQAEEALDTSWLMPGVAVLCHGVNEGTVEEAVGGEVRVRLEDKITPFVPNDLSMVKPAKGDPVMVISGDSKGTTGSLIGLDGEDGIVKLPDHDIAIFEMTILAKYTELK